MQALTYTAPSVAANDNIKPNETKPAFTVPEAVQEKRNLWIPTDATIIQDDESDAIAYVYKSPDGYPAVVAFVGRQSKPCLRYFYFSQDAASKAIKSLFAGRRRTLETKAKWSEEAKARSSNADYEIGDILCSSWGYEQTNVDFFQVVGKAGKSTLELRKIAAQTIEDTGNMSATVAPIKDHFIADPIRCRVSNGSIKIESYQNASPWNGRPVHCSWYA